MSVLVLDPSVPTSYMLAPPCAIYTCLWEKPQMRDRGEPEALSEALQDGSREIGRVKHGQGHQELQRKRGKGKGQ